MKEKKGISLIVLIVTIIVMIIISGAIILTLTETNIIDQAEVAVEKHNDSELQTAANMAYSNWLLKTKTGDVEEKKNILGIKNYIRNELVSQNVLTWEETSKYCITERGKLEKVDQEAFTFVIEVTAPINHDIEVYGYEEDSYVKIDWGNGNITDTINNVEIVTYEPGVYEIKITGKNIYQIILDSISGDVTEIKSWGNIEAQIINFTYLSDKLEYVAAPNKNSFSKLEEFDLSATILECIPDEMFKDCINLSYANFCGCENLKYIPDNLFKNLDISKIDIDFSGCTSASNYDSIPDAWKQH